MLSFLNVLKAFAGNGRAQLSLANWYLTRDKRPKHEERALGWARRSGRNGEPRAYLLVAHILFQRELTDDVKSQIFEAYQAAASGGDADGQQCLAWCYEQGVGVERDSKLMLRWLRTAAMGGSRVSQLELARRYAEGDGVPLDEAKAKAFLSMNGTL